MTYVLTHTYTTEQEQICIRILLPITMVIEMTMMVSLWKKKKYEK